MTGMDSQVKDNNILFWTREYSRIALNFSPLSAEVVDPVAGRLNDCSCKTVLDLGCGLGRMSIALAQRGFKVTAVDFMPGAIAWVQKWAQKENLAIETDICAAEELSVHNLYDAVYCNSVLDHMMIKAAQMAAGKIVQALKPGGIAYISFDGNEPEDPHSYSILGDGTHRYISGDRNGKLWRFYSDQEIKVLCRGFEIIEFTTAGNGKRNVWLKNL